MKIFYIIVALIGFGAFCISGFTQVWWLIFTMLSIIGIDKRQ